MSVRRGVLVAALAVAGVSPAAFAQMEMPGAGPGTYGAAPPEATIPERQSILQRPHPDYDPLGIRAGTFLIFPYADLSETYDSNVFAIPSGVKSDFYTDVAPDIAVRSDWNNHALNLDAGGDIKRYAKLVSENVSNAHFTTSGRLDILRDIYALGGASYQLAHEDRSSPNSITGQKNPTEYQVGGAGLGYVHESGRLGFRIDGIVNYYSYNNAQTATGVTITETDRNRLEAYLRPRVQYEIVPGYHAFVQAWGNIRDYQAQFDSNGFDKNSKGYEVDAGTAVDVSHVLTGEVFIGYLRQNYSSDHNALTTVGLKPATGVGFGGRLLWNVTQLTSVRLTLARTVQETIVTTTVGTTVVDASSDLQLAAGVSVEHELLRNVLLTGGVIFVQDAFQGIVRTDDSYEADAGARYLINRNFSAGLDLSWRKRNSNEPGFDYEREIVTARVRAQF